MLDNNAVGQKSRPKKKNGVKIYLNTEAVQPQLTVGVSSFDLVMVLRGGAT